MGETDRSELPDLTRGISIESLASVQCVVGRVGDDEVLVVRSNDAFYAVGAHCTHYHGPLAEGLIVGETIRCPWHHACFSLRTGEALRAPALDDVPCWRVDRQGDKVVVKEKLPARDPERRSSSPRGNLPASILIVGGGAAGVAAADVIRREGYDGAVTIVSAETDPPVDRPNLSKDYLAGKAPEDWMPLRPSEFYTERHIELILGTRVVAVDATARTIKLENGTERNFGALLLATGAEPVRLPIPGADGSRLFYLRSFAEGRAIAAAASPTSTALIIGSSFIGLEVAASLRSRGIPVHVVAPEHTPLERVLGRDAGRFVQQLHEEKGVNFHLGRTVERLSGRTATLSGGDRLETDFVVVGAGVRPATDLAATAGLRIDNGIVVNEFLETSAAGIFAAGDAARWPNPITGRPTRIEHWVVAERQGQIAARNMLGQRERFDVVPFFWSQHYDTIINYVGFSEPWDAVIVDGTLESRDCRIRYEQNGRTVAVATIFRGRESLQAEVDMEREIANPNLTRSPRQ